MQDPLQNSALPNQPREKINRVFKNSVEAGPESNRFKPGLFSISYPSREDISLPDPIRENYRFHPLATDKQQRFFYTTKPIKICKKPLLFLKLY